MIEGFFASNFVPNCISLLSIIISTKHYHFITRQDKKRRPVH